MKLIDDGVINRTVYEGLKESEKFQYWQISRNKFKLIAKMDNEHLQKAFFHSQKKELEYHNSLNLFIELKLILEEVAKKRGLKLEDLDTEYHKALRKYEERTKEE